MRILIRAIALSLVFVLPSVSGAQDPRAGSLRGGFTFSMSSSTFAGSSYPGAGRRTSFNPGAVIEVPMTASMELRTGIVLATRGARRDIPGGHEEVILDYLEVPLLFSFQPAAGAFRPYAIVGAHLAFALDCTVADESGGMSGRAACVNVVPTPRLAMHDVALLGGAGLRHTVEQLVVSYELLYAHGLQRYDASGDSRNRGLSLGAVLTFPLSFR